MMKLNPARLEVMSQPKSAPPACRRSFLEGREVNMEKLTHSELIELLDYCPEHGHFLWKKLRNGARRDLHAGCLTKNGYITIRINGIPYLAHRLAWFYVHGEFPAKVIDHINQIRNDNRIANLRSVTQVENCKNTRVRNANKTGANGVRFRDDGRKSPWNARVMHKGKNLSLGHFKTFEEAVKARQEWDKKFWNATA